MDLRIKTGAYIQDEPFGKTNILLKIRNPKTSQLFIWKTSENVFLLFLCSNMSTYGTDSLCGQFCYVKLYLFRHTNSAFIC